MNAISGTDPSWSSAPPRNRLTSCGLESVAARLQFNPSSGKHYCYRLGLRDHPPQAAATPSTWPGTPRWRKGLVSDRDYLSAQRGCERKGP